jgi:hypothetical protein
MRFEYALMIEQLIGKPLPSQAKIHHVDRDPSNNKNSNLVVCENQEYHLFLHRRTRALKECGHANWQQCVYCKEWDSPDNLYRWGGGKGKKCNARHPNCHRIYMCIKRKIDSPKKHKRLKKIIAEMIK